MKQSRSLSSLSNAPLAAVLLTSLLVGCSGSSDDSTNYFEVVRTEFASASSSPVTVNGNWLVYLASEALSGVGGTNFNVANGDVDQGDDCAVVVNMVNKSKVNLNVATTAVLINSNEIYLIVSEAADTKDWNLDTDLLDTVLLHYSSTSALSYVSDIKSATNSWGIAGGRLYFVRADTTGLVNGQSTLAYLTTSSPKVPVTVLHTDANSILEPTLGRVDENLLFLFADETVQGADLNGDADMLDPYVLALLNGNDISGVIQNVGLSMQDPTSPARARSTGTNDWLVGFLVEEASQSNFVTGLNDPTVGAFGFGGAWKPSNCPTYVDADVNDQVLHVLDYSLWSANPGANPPENTGIPGTDRVLCTSTVVATLALEVDDGGCDLNADGDTGDTILRWAAFTSPQLPFGTASQLNAVTTATPGGTFGISDLSNKFICVVSELDDNTDHDLDGLKTHNLVAWLNPTVGSPIWTFDHNSSAAVSYVGASWMMDRPQRDRLLVAYEESVANQSINTGGDNDKLDSVPTFARFDPNNANDLDFPGPAVAISANNAGNMIVNGYGLYRVDEAADNRDWNGDTDKNDFVIFRTDLSSNFSAYIGVANSLSAPVAFNAGTVGAAYLAQESMNGQDFNGDGRTDGFIVSYFRVN